MPFEDETPKKKKLGVKLNNKDSVIEPPKVPTSVAFEQKANEAFAKIESYKQRMWELSGKYKAIIEDRMLSQNKTVISKDLEKEVLDKLIAVASEMNDDNTQPESLGATALAMLLMKMNLIQRDIINELGYKVDKLERAVRLLEKPA
jgi:hypothetical protein